eukprot:442032-Pelagomonas_calceolata.AAC.1
MVSSQYLTSTIWMCHYAGRSWLGWQILQAGGVAVSPIKCIFIAIGGTAGGRCRYVLPFPSAFLQKEEKSPAKRPCALRKDFTTSKLAKVSFYLLLIPSCVTQQTQNHTEDHNSQPHEATPPTE